MLIVFLFYSKFTITPSMSSVRCENFEKCAALTLSCLVSSLDTFYNNASAKVELSLSAMVVEEDLSIIEPVAISSENEIPKALLNGDETQCWDIIWAVFHHVNYLTPDRDLVVNLKEIRTNMTGEVLDKGIAELRKSIGSRTGGDQILSKMDEIKMRTFVKNLMQIGSNLSQTREYRDLFEDVLTKVAETLKNEFGLNILQSQIFLINCACIVNVLPQARSNIVNSNRRKNWIRFLLCARFLVKLLV
jgi:hypothetical protein